VIRFSGIYIDYNEEQTSGGSHASGAIHTAEEGRVSPFRATGATKTPLQKKKLGKNRITLLFSVEDCQTTVQKYDEAMK
jgi:hypothetical protein